MQSKSKKKIILTGGGTAGHVIPLLSVANELNKSNSYNFLFLGSGKEIERNLVIKDGIKYRKIFCGKWRRNINPVTIIQNIVDLFKTVIGLILVYDILKRERPDLIISKGGYVSLPVSLSGGLLKIPIISHESDLVIGLANKLALKYCTYIATAFPISFYPKAIARKAIYAGIPLRKEFGLEGKTSNSHILIMGGSSGAKSLNEIFYKIGESVLKDHKVVHITGQTELDKALLYKRSLEKKLALKYKPIGFSNNISTLIKNSKLIITRAGATSIFEIASFSKKAILVPISSGVGSHQKLNAEVLMKLGLVKVFDQGRKPEELIKEIKRALKEDFNLGKLAFSKSAKLIANVAEDVIDKQSLTEIKNVFLIGMSGVSMKGIKYILEKMGKHVSGSDLKIGGHSKNNISKNLDLVIYSSAVKRGSPGYVELEEANKNKIKTLKRSELISWLLKGKRSITVSGMHGKTTISLLLARIFEADERAPSYLVGAPYSLENPSFEFSEGTDFIVEACEYDGSFLDFKSMAGVISNIEEEHMDYFKDINDIRNHFEKYIEKIYPGGALAYCVDDKNVIETVKKKKKEIDSKNISLYSYGFSKDAHFRICDYLFQSNVGSFKIKSAIGNYSVITRIAGEHFALNVTASFAIALHHGINPEIALSAIADFEGATRRMEFVGIRSGAMLYDDYAHHPTEISATIKALNQMHPKNRKIIIFEPHQQKRFNEHFNQYVDVFSKSDYDLLALLPVYSVPGRDEKPKKRHTDISLGKSSKKTIVYLENYEDAIGLLQDNLKKGDIVLTMGATDINKILLELMNDNE